MKPLMVVMLICVAVLPVIKSKTNKTPVRYSGFSCLSGRPGIPGLHGKPGAPGRDGRDGREGIQGKRGPRGFQGSPGSQGRPGSPGSDGKPGARGPQGLKGDAGPKGDKGDRGPRGLSSHSNWKECSWKNIDDGKDKGLIKNCFFHKKYSHTVLHVYWNGDFRIYGCNNCCKRWFFTFNGAECKSPNAIDGILHMGTGKNQNIHRVRHIEGHCDKIHKGKVNVGFNVGNCKGYGNADARTGWNSVSRLFIEEVPRPQK
ncbi:collagen triple helix repeat-containing protein 1 [Exaiptasia diaphana]|uniref:CTHRC1 C-terminal domain-containing protein n=1 Tax=Exaiptasia diaphana TaxID=2652724 RepID=A0A913YIS0_EXADI|nr:collagen triple helix repeat-containing protein 1 [Exaiptasia diaphana]XP_028514276.1 collagen triple helix repeat-containing protein 1 [Exaiptasia diaphana]